MRGKNRSENGAPMQLRCSGKPWCEWPLPWQRIAWTNPHNEQTRSERQRAWDARGWMNLP